MVLPFCIFYLFLCIKAEVINIQPTSKSCEDTQYHGTSTRNDTLQDGLDNISSNTVLILSPGCHYLNRFTPVMSKTNISIIGDGNSSDDIVITCENGVGVVFLNVSQLELKGLTFTQCNLTGQNLNKTLSNIKGMSVFSLVFDIPTSVEVTLLIANSIDVTIDKVYINDTHGYGLIAINVLESFVITSSVISNNYNRDCYYVDPSYYHGIGGGAIILYHDTKLPSTHSRLAITNTSFLYNSNCGYSTFSEIYAAYTDSLFLDNAQYVIGGGGGLTIYLIHHGYDVTLDISNCYFQNNAARFGGAIYVGFFIGVSNTTVNIENSTFHRNGLYRSNISDPGFTTTGQGITIVTDILFPSSYNYPSIPIGINNYIIRNCIFTENLAFSAAAVFIYSGYITITPNLIPNIILFDKCIFSENKAYIGSAVYLIEQKNSGAQLGIQIILKDSEVYNNALLTSEVGFSSTSTTSSSIIEILSVHVSLCGITRFANNNGTPIHAKSSVLHIDGEAYFTNNTGALGGALGLISASFLIINKNSHVNFFRNQAFYYGGAIYTEYTGSEYAGNYFDCYLFFDKIDLECARFKNCIDPTTLNITVSFNLNQASTADVVYGSTLQTCPWVDKLRTSCNSSSSVYDLLGECGIFQYTQNLSSQSLATPPYRISTSINSSSPLMPGQQLMVTMNAYDRFEQIVPNPITSSVIDNLAAGETKSVLGESGYWFIDHQKFHDVPVSIRSDQEPIQQEEIEVGIFSLTSTAQTHITINIRECYLGFEFDNNGSQNYKTCICIRLLQNRSDINCDADTATITVPNGKWVGYVSGNRLAIHSCVLNYCKIGGANITNGDFDVQCNEGFGRVGVLCGQCKEGYSIQFGTNECKKCSNYYLFLLIYFIVAGVVLIWMIGTLGVTVSHGFLNSMLFYCNIVTPYQQYLLSNSFYYPIMYPIVILNLDMGFPVCFYNGMTSLVRWYLFFVFPIYLWILMGIYTRLSRYQWWQRRWTNTNPTQVFASVMLMSYISILRACFGALSITHLENADHLWRWTIDPSVVYFSLEHAPMGVLSIIIILIHIIPAPLFLLFPPLTLRTPWGRKFLPIYDAFWAPFRPGYQFWVGLRLFLRLLPFIFALYVPNPLNILLLGIFAVFYLLVHIYFKPFKGEAQNFLDIYLTLNIILLAIGSMYFSLKINNAQSEDSVMNDEKYETVYISLVVFLVYIAFLCVYIYHLVLKYECLQNWLKSLQHKFRARFSKKKETSNIQSTDNSGSSDYSLTTQLNIIPKPPTYSVLREPLLDDI